MQLQLCLHAGKSELLWCLQVTMISQQEVPFLKERGVRIIDIRPQAEYDRAHLQDSVNIQFYRAITGTPLQHIQKATVLGCMATRPFAAARAGAATSQQLTCNKTATLQKLSLCFQAL